MVCDIDVGHDWVLTIQLEKGMTIHSWGAVSPTTNNVGQQIACIKTCKPAFQRWKRVKVLIIDEGTYATQLALPIVPLLHIDRR